LSSTDFLVAFSENIRSHTLSKFGERNIFKLFLPPVDPREFKFTTEKESGKFAIYNGKYKVFGLGQIGNLSEDVVLIEREGKNAPNRSDLKKILNSVEAVIAFENSSIITEAIMSGTVGVFYPNDFLTEVIAEKELGWEGTLWGWNVNNLSEAKKTLVIARENYILQIKKFLSDLDIFILQTQLSVSKVAFEKPVRIPTFRTFVTMHRLRLAHETYKNAGLLALYKQTIDFLKRRVTTAKIRKNDPLQGRETLEFELQ
jgi:hypothetical protein